MKSKILIPMLAILLLGLVVVSLPKSTLAKETLKVGTDAAYPPFEYVDEKTGKYTGFDMDLIRALGQEMGYEIEIINTSFAGIIPGLFNGNYDLIIAAMTITDERSQAINFSDPYFTAGQVIVTKKNTTDILVPADLKGKVVSVQLGTTGQFATEKIKGVKEIKKFDTSPAALQELLNGAAHAAVIDLGVAQLFMKEHSGLKIVGEPFTAEYYGIGLKKQNKDLLKKLNQALAKLKANGKYEEIYTKWFGAGQ